MANNALKEAGLHRLKADVGDAGITTPFAEAVPADLVMVCGVFGNVSDTDVRKTIEALPTLCAQGATVVWTRHRREPDLTPAIQGWFGEAGFDLISFDSPGPGEYAVGTHHLKAAPQPYVPNLPLFTFTRT